MRTFTARLTIAAATLAMSTQAALAQGTPVDQCAAANAGNCTASALSQQIELSRPEPLRNSAYISQVGDANSALIVQKSTRQSARIVQDGEANAATVTQSGDGTVQFELEQTGRSNSFSSRQEAASAGSNVATVAQEGDNNVILLDQSAAAGDLNGAILAQDGNGNEMQLEQSGSDNRAELVQFGDNNTMTATQNGSANQLRWVQNGNGLSDLQIVQSGSQAMSITQSNGGT